MKSPWTRAIALTTALTLTAGTAGCGWLLHPERRGQPPGNVIDGTTLIFDLLWLLPGVVPGVVFLIVDFTDDTIYVGGGGRMAMKATPQGDVAVKLLDQKRAMKLDLQLVTASHHVLDRQIAVVGPDVHDRTVQLNGGPELRAAGEPVFVQITDTAHPDKPMQLRVTL